MPSLPDNLPVLLLVAGMLLLIVVLRRRSARYYRAQSAEPRAIERLSRASAGAASQSHQAPDDLAAWEVHLHETARELAAELDTKASALRHYIRLAQEERERLQRAIDESRRATP
jgi:hypothetical protein